MTHLNYSLSIESEVEVSKEEDWHFFIVIIMEPKEKVLKKITYTNTHIE